MTGLVTVPSASASDVVSGYASGYDGDRIDIAGRRLHLAGVDAPERGQTCADADGRIHPCGREAEWALAEKVAGRLVRCTLIPDDPFHRNAATCRLDAEDLAAWLVAQGHAVADRRLPTPYTAQEDAAKAEKRGIWAGAFTLPWELRDGARGPGDGYAVPLTHPSPAGSTSRAQAERGGCAIKGNITREGTRLYWVPGSRRYAETVVTEAKGERWFCTEEEAKLAGWLEPAKDAPTQ